MRFRRKYAGPGCEAGRRLGIFLRRRERAASEFRRRNIFELYIEEVVAACNRLKGGNPPTEKIERTVTQNRQFTDGGLKTDEALGKTGAGPEGLPHSIIVTAGRHRRRARSLRMFPSLRMVR